MAGSLDAERIKAEVRREVMAALDGAPAATSPTSARSPGLVTEEDVAAARSGSRTLYIARGALVTPLARDAAERYGVRLVEGEPPRPAPPRPVAATAPPPSPAAAAPPSAPAAPLQRAAGCTHTSLVAIGSDHAGYRLKAAVKRHLEARGFRVIDFGVDGEGSSVDYPDFVVPAAAAVARGDACRAIVCDCHGNASAMTANKIPGVRAACSRSLEEVESSREHNDINVLCLGQKTLSEAEAFAIVDGFLSVAFAGDRHARRLGKVEAVESAFCRAALGARAATGAGEAAS